MHIESEGGHTRDFLSLEVNMLGDHGDALLFHLIVMKGLY
jgi:hypothetical protein